MYARFPGIHVGHKYSVKCNKYNANLTNTIQKSNKYSTKSNKYSTKCNKYSAKSNKYSTKSSKYKVKK